MNIKKLIASVTATAIVATQALTGLATVNAAYTNPEWAQAVNFMKTEGLSSVANSVDQYLPLATVKREAAAKFFTAFAEKEFGRTADTTKVCNFSDINEANPVFVPYITKACQMGIIKGANGKAMPKATLTKLQFLTILARIVKNNPNLEPVAAFNTMKAEGVTKAASLADTVRPVSRIELAILFQRAVAKYAKQDSNDNSDADLNSIISGLTGDNDNNNQDNGNATTTGNNNQDNSSATGNNNQDNNNNTQEDKLVVAVDPATPAEQYVPGTGSHIQVLKFDLTAGGKDVTVKAATVKLSGMINKDNIKNVYIEDENGVVLTNQRGFNTDYEARLVFDGNYVVKAGESKGLYLVMDVKNSTNELIKMSITDLDASSTVNGLPVVSNVIHTTAYSSTTVKFVSDLTGEKEVANINNVLYVGDTNKEIMKFELTNGGENNKDVALKSIRFRGVETLEGKIDNVKLLAGGTVVNATATVDGKYLTFNINNYVLKDGDTKTFYVHADVVGGEKDDRIQLYLDETSDISAIEADTNAATAISVDGSKAYGKAYKIKEGDNLITKSSESPSSAYVPNDEDDITVLVANVNTSSEMYVEKVRVYRDNMTADSTDIKRVKLYINDKYVDETDTTGSDSKGEYYEFSYYSNLKGANKFVVKVDTENNARDGKTIRFTINGDSIAFGSNAEYVASKNTVTNVKGSATSSTLTIKKPAISSVSETSGIADNEVLIAGAQNALVAKYTFQANNVRDVKVTDLTLDVTGDTDNISTLSLAVNGQVVDTENVNGTSVTFNSVNVNVPRGSTAEVSVLATLTTSYNTGAAFQVTLPAQGVTAEDAKGNTVDSVPSTAIAGPLFNVKTSATLYVSADSNTPVENVVAANPNVEQEVARFKFKATDDDAQIQELALVNVSKTFTGDNATAAADATTGADAVVNKVVVYNTNGDKLGEATLTNGVAYFAFANPVNLTKDQDTVLVVKVKANAINDESNTNKTVRFAVLKPGVSIGTQQTKVISKANGEEVANVNYPSAAVANTQYIRKTVISLANNTQTTTSLVAGSNDIYLFKVSADAAGAVKVKTFTFDVTFGGNSSNPTTGYEFYINGSKEDNVDVAAAATNGTTTVTVTFTGNYENGYEITAGSTVNFKLVATNVSTTGDNDSITARLNEKSNDTDKVDTTYTGATSVLWSDEAADSVTGGTQDWFTDANLSTLPLNGETLSK